jgi:hypothetical protein
MHIAWVITSVDRSVLDFPALDGFAGEAFADGERRVLIYGVDPRVSSGESACVVLGSEGFGGSEDPCLIAAAIEEGAQTVLGVSPDIWHWVGVLPGAHPALDAAICLMAKRGARLLLEVPQFCRQPLLEWVQQFAGHPGEVHECFPVASHVHYAAQDHGTLNLLRCAGVDASRLWWTPAALDVPLPVFDDDVRLWGKYEAMVLAPQCAERWQNLGELLLHATVCSRRTTYASLWGPRNRGAVRNYQHWVDFAQEMGIRVNLGVSDAFGLKPSLLMEHCARVCHTAVAGSASEALLEPWLYGKALHGRYPMESGPDLERLGLDLSGLYRELPIPIAAFRFDEFRFRLQTSLREHYRALDMVFDPTLPSRWVDLQVRDQRVDFALLDEIAQREVIEAVDASLVLQRDLRPIMERPWCNQELIDRNAVKVDSIWGRAAYLDRMQEVHEAVAASDYEEVTGFADVAVILSFRLDLNFFRPLLS